MASTDGGTAWSVLTPEEGYDGTISASYGNPIGGTPGFGGYSYGWQRRIVRLPEADEVRVRFDFGTDESNAGTTFFDYAGWFVDDVTVTTVLPVDDTPPVLGSAPPAVIGRTTREAPPVLDVEVDDDTGVTRVEAAFQFVSGAGTSAGVQRLAMAPSDLGRFRGAITPPEAPRVGDRIEYRLTIEDADGNRLVYPAPEEAPLRVEYRLGNTISALNNVRPSGLWRQAPEGGYAASAAGSDAPPRSGLVLEPFDLPGNATDIVFALEHRYQLGSGLGGNVKLSTDRGETWTVLAPREGYALTFTSGASHPMDGEAVFSGDAGDLAAATFDLTPYAGRQVRLRLDFAAARAPGGGEAWRVQEAFVQFSTLDDAFDIPRELALHPNFPDPFGDNTTFSYTLPEAMPVRLELYNVLGQRVAVLLEGERPAGTHTLTMGRGSLASGVYVLRLQAGGTQKVERMIITR
jgi:hypothetical protein